MRRRTFQRAFVGIGAVSIAFGCTTISGVDKYDVERASPLTDSTPPATDASTLPQESPDTGAPIGTDAGTDDSGMRDAAAPARRVFITSATFTGNLGGLDGADLLCKQAAGAAGLGDGVWRAWLSAKSVNALSRLPYAGPYVLVDGRRVSDDAADLVKGTLQHPINADEYGSAAGADGGSTVVWTSTDEHGQAKPTNVCADWKSASFFDWGEIGSATSLGADWSNGDGRRCSESAHLYCFEQ